MKKENENIAKSCMPKNMILIKCSNMDYPHYFRVLYYEKGWYHIGLPGSETVWKVRKANLLISKK